MNSNRASIGLIQKTYFYYTSRFKKIWFVPTINALINMFVFQFLASVIKGLKDHIRGLDAVMTGKLSPQIFIRHHLQGVFVTLIVALFIKYTTDVIFDFYITWHIKSDEKLSNIGRRWRSIFAVKLALLLLQIIATVSILTLSTTLPEINHNWFLGLLGFVLFGLLMIAQITLPDIVFKYSRALAAIKNSIALFRRHPILTLFILLTGLIPTFFASIPAKQNIIFKVISLVLAPLFYTAVYALWERDKLEVEYEKKIKEKQMKASAKRNPKRKRKN